MRNVLTAAAILTMIVACGGDKAVGPIVSPPNNPPGSDPRIVLYAVPQGQPQGTVSISFNKVKADQAGGGVSQEPWNADSVVYAIGSPDAQGNIVYPDGDITLSLVAQVKDFNTTDSAGVSNTSIEWVVDQDQYSHDPAQDQTGYGLASTTSTTDDAGTTVNKFVFSEANLKLNHGYFYVEAHLKDSTGAERAHAKFFVFNYQPPTLLTYWDGQFPAGGFDHLTVPIAADVPFDIAAHVTLPVVGGADTRLGTLGIDSIVVVQSINESVHGQVFSPDDAVSGCTVLGTVVSCSAEALNGNPQVNIYPRYSDYPSSSWDLNAYTWLHLSLSQ